MNPILTVIDDRRMLLKNRIADKEKVLRNVPKGRLRVSGGARELYYYIDEEQKKGGCYLGRKESNRVKKLAQKEYDQQVLALSRKELNVLDALRRQLPGLSGEEVYEKLAPARRKLVTPVELPDEEFIRLWEAEEYEKKLISDDIPEYYTDRGERVRSKSEILLANMLYQRGIPYRYECAVYLDNNEKVFPDFTVLNVRLRKQICHEHFGRMSDPEYAEKAINKLSTYNRNGYYLGDQLTCTWESGKQPLNVREFERIIEHYFL